MQLVGTNLRHCRVRCCGLARAVAVALLASMPVTVTLAAAGAGWKSADAFLRREMVERQIVGMAVAVIQRGKVRTIATYGQASKEYGLAVRRSTPFSVASISKSFTAVAVMMLVEARRVRLDDPIGTHLNELPPGWQGVTVRQLLNHTSGLPDIALDDYTTATIAPTSVEAIRILAERPREFAPGSGYRYNQTNYMLLGMLIARLSGKSYEAFLAERMFLPLELRTAEFGDARAVVSQRAVTYTPFRYGNSSPIRMAGLEVLNAEMPAMAYPGGGLNISIADFADWLAALLNGRLISADSLQMLWTPARLADGTTFRRPAASSLWREYGLGWVLSMDGAHPFAGGSGGIRAAFFVYPRDEIAIIVLTNTQGSGAESLAQGVAQRYFLTSD